MGNQATPVTDAVQDFTPEKIILSGSPFVSSILGPGAYLIAADLAPLFYTDPVVTGPIVPPAELICGEGSFNSSPRATLTYQWKRDTINITDETSNIYITIASDVGTSITCEVTATNASGFDTALSNEFLPEAVDVGYLYEMHVGVITGLAVNGRMDMNSATIQVISGMVHELQETVMSVEAYMVTGMAVDVIQQTLSVGAYAMYYPLLLTPLVVLNGDAESADMSDWTIDSGGVTSETTANGNVTKYRGGARFFMPEDLGQGVDSQMSQVMVIDAGDLTDVDLGRCYCITRFLELSVLGNDNLVVTLDALDAGDSILNSTVYNVPAQDDDPGWRRENTLHDPLSLPTLTRKIKITILFDTKTGGLSANSVYIDDISVELLKIE